MHRDWRGGFSHWAWPGWWEEGGLALACGWAGLAKGRQAGPLVIEGRQPRHGLERGAVNGASGCALLVAEEEELDVGA